MLEVKMQRITHFVRAFWPLKRFYSTLLYTFANTTNREQNHFFAEQNIVRENRVNVLLYTIRCSPSIFA